MTEYTLKQRATFDKSKSMSPEETLLHAVIVQSVNDFYCYSAKVKQYTQKVADILNSFSQMELDENISTETYLRIRCALLKYCEKNNLDEVKELFYK